MHNLLLADLVADLPPAIRLQRLVSSLRAHFRCGAVALLQQEEDHLRPIAVDGLTQDALGRRFAVHQHPRLAAILARRGVTCFHHDSTLPDPYDGLINGMAGEPLPVHDCMGTSLHVEGKPWGVLTLDALDVGTFDGQAQSELRDAIVLVEAALRTTRLETEIRALRDARGPAPADSVAPDRHEILGNSPPITRLLHEIQVVADSDLPILLLGETGVGKELFAHRVHRLSRRSGKPLVHVNCAALPESLAESELFGHAKGAFSGAVTDRPGRFEAANGGTLFLDEVGELPLLVQAKLLRALQNGEIQRLGDDRPRTVDVRIVAATNRSLSDLVQAGDFRADLYHRLSVYPVPIPPLRERGNDVLLLAGRYLELNRARLGLRSLRLSEDAEEMLRRYSWPGNVRELEHVISRAAIKAVSHGANRNDIITLETSLLDVSDHNAPVPVTEALALDDGPAAGQPSLRDTVDACQRQAIRRALQAHDGNWAHAARALDVDPSNLHKLARRLGLKQ
ncbi:nitric oxide reductase transcription regulator [Achromobacter marplatensis]|uniref:Anaerobic nitric oxide reductase transcription regulator n=1 Tax=Achromobacter marplatensis TaxID=470868 RepID=A0ABX9GI32_9BURK|nr:nitric oxide reductase transcriptional regulator NorR [Achromobacter marplatensis]OWT71079.1 nitric oxide reductase transcription regulator [Achromobacter marplatensis]RBP22704.1 anaerobic nitric oxide reductase transcription regulator [Achromobacter marplatensis]CAB3647645.1 Nitric oxide reductase transcription regulator NorR2 [Achromobacter marplatensis]